jgi:uncharacterized protein (TIGR00730 family)
MPESLSRRQQQLIDSMRASVDALASPDSDILDLKIVDTTLREFTEAFDVFRPYRNQRKLTMFGSARTPANDPIYVMARDLAQHIADLGWMVVTGAGPGIMQAGTEGAGRERSFGVNILLPHEQGANPIIANDPKLVEMRYFFTRKLMLVRESHAYAVLPGGFGTLDEIYELLTLLQTGKAMPAPVLLVERPGDDYWQHWEEFTEKTAMARGYISPPDRSLYKIVTGVDDALSEIDTFYRNYRSLRFFGEHLVIRLNYALDAVHLEALNEAFADIVVDDTIRVCEPRAEEISDNDDVQAPRLGFRYNRVDFGRLRQLIDVVNTARP